MNTDVKFHTGARLLDVCAMAGVGTISEAMTRREIAIGHTTREAALHEMARTLYVMKRSALAAVNQELRSIGGLIGGEARRMFARRDRSVCGTIMSRACACALAVLETNASMGLIVAAPTAGASGVLPGVLCALQEEFHLNDGELVSALFNAGAVGYLIQRNATVSGAEGGCQAEVGSASAMAASAAVQLMGGTPQQCLDAASIALGNLLGLVCDPVAGLVEVPCQKRNAVGAANALVCAEMVLSGITAVIPFDETVKAMLKVGRALPAELRETALGGLAATPTACALCKKCS